MLTNYNKALQQRNALLKDIVRHPELEDTLDIWDERLILFGTQVTLERIAFCRALAPKAAEIYSGIAKEREGRRVFLRAVSRRRHAGEDRGGVLFCP